MTSYHEIEIICRKVLLILAIVCDLVISWDIVDAMILIKIDHLTDEMAECTDNCLEAAQACEWSADACIDEDGDITQCIRLCQDIVYMITFHAWFLARNSNYSAELAEVCAGACEECVEECDRHDTEHCPVCADVLRERAETCRNMASA